MVLFTERETMLLLDMYLRLRMRDENVAANGVLLKAPARAKLTRAINRSVGDNKGRVWTEGQVFVKFKNLRVDYAQVKWLHEQPGFKENGEGMSKDWWMAIKATRPKAHVFKGKLPWPFFRRMAMILNDAPYDAQVTDAATEQRITQILDAVDAAGVDDVDHESAAVDPAAVDTDDNTTTITLHTTTNGAIEPVATPAKRLVTVTTTPKRARAVEPEPEATQQQQQQGTPVAATPTYSSSNKRSRTSVGSSVAAASPSNGQDDRSSALASHHESLSRSVEQCSVAAAGMARGFQELVAVFQTQAEKCRRLETTSGAIDADAVAGERHVLLSIARSLEKSTQASADMARGYHDLIEHYVRESESRRLL